MNIIVCTFIVFLFVFIRISIYIKKKLLLYSCFVLISHRIYIKYGNLGNGVANFMMMMILLKLLYSYMFCVYAKRFCGDDDEYTYLYENRNSNSVLFVVKRKKKKKDEWIITFIARQDEDDDDDDDNGC